MTAAAAVEQLSPAELQKLTACLEKDAKRRVEENALKHYKPYIKQLDFHVAGATYRERLLMAGNQLGKTLAGGFEVAMHASGHYPDWWQGKRFDRPTNSWVAGITGETVRDTVQRILVGREGAQGTGAVPKDALAELVPARGVPGLLDTIRVRHVLGGVSTIGLKSYEKGREKFQGETLDFCWLDEEPDISIYTEVLTRTNVGGGPIFMTFTPLLGVSGVVSRFLHEKSPDRNITSMTIEDVEHFSADERRRIIASYPKQLHHRWRAPRICNVVDIVGSYLEGDVAQFCLFSILRCPTFAREFTAASAGARMPAVSETGRRRSSPPCPS